MHGNKTWLYNRKQENRRQHKEIEDYFKWWERWETSKKISKPQKLIDGPPKNHKDKTRRKTIAWSKHSNTRRKTDKPCPPKKPPDVHEMVVSSGRRPFRTGWTTQEETKQKNNHQTKKTKKIKEERLGEVRWPNKWERNSGENPEKITHQDDMQNT